MSIFRIWHIVWCGMFNIYLYLLLETALRQTECRSFRYRLHNTASKLSLQSVSCVLHSSVTIFIFKSRLSWFSEVNPTNVPAPIDYSKPYMLKCDSRGSCYASPLSDDEVPPLPSYADALECARQPTPTKHSKSNDDINVVWSSNFELSLLLVYLKFAEDEKHWEGKTFYFNRLLFAQCTSFSLPNLRFTIFNLFKHCQH